jgi:hypothetical protein
MMKRSMAILGAAVGISVATLAHAAEHAVPRSEVPAAVLKAVTAKYPRGQMIRFIREVDNGKTAYEVQLDLGNAHTELIVAPDGKIQFEELVILFKDLPLAVQRGFTSSRFAQAKVLRVERVTKEEKADVSTYEMVVELHAKKHELAFDRAGKLVGAERADGED